MRTLVREMGADFSPHYEPSRALFVSDIVSGCIGIISQNEETAVPCPYKIILGRDTALPSPLDHSVVTGIDMIPFF